VTATAAESWFGSGRGLVNLTLTDRSGAGFEIGDWHRTKQS